MIIHSKEFAYTTDAQFESDVQAWIAKTHADSKATPQEFEPRNIKQSFVTTSRVLVTLVGGI